jgi:predicted nucleic acid-binding protein
MARLVRGHRLTADRALILAREAELQMARREYGVESHAVLTLAFDSGCSAYDCEYVALADALDVPLVTFDAEIMRAFPTRAIAPEDFLRD